MSDSGIRLVLGIRGKGARQRSEVQSVLFSRGAWTADEARRWLATHGYRTPAPDVTEQYLRFRQRDPKQYERFATIPAGPRTNPVEEAAELAEAWHGRPASKITEVEERIREHEVLVDLGGLEEIELVDPPVVIRFGHDTRLASNEQGTQLYLVGGDQAVDLDEFPVDRSKEQVVLGEVSAVTYYAAKQHLGGEHRRPGPYRHEFGEEGGTRPQLVYDTRNRLLSLAGGSYKILRDMPGGYSAGIRD